MNDRLRIAFVSAFPPGTGSLNEYGWHLTREIAARPDVEELLIIADRLGREADEPDLGPKVRIERVWGFNEARTAPSILRALRAFAPDGAIYNLQMASFGDREVPAALGLLAPGLSRLIGIPSGVIAHNLVLGVDLDQTTLRGRPIRKKIVAAGGAVVTRALLAASYMTVTLRSYVDAIEARWPGSPVELVPHGTFDTDDRPLVPAAGRPMRIVTMGKFGTYKRLETLIKAFRRVRDTGRFPGLELVIGGSDHPATPGYLNLVAQSCMDDPDIRFHGYIAEEDIPGFFGEARVSVFDYSATTGSSGVLHQTASYGAVPVFPAIGDFVDVCRDEGLTGENYGVGDDRGMADAIMRLLGNPDHADALAASNRRAANDMPLSEVAAYHVERIRLLRRSGSVLPMASPAAPSA